MPDWYIDLALAQGRPEGRALLRYWLLSIRGAR